ncbi:MAG: hypothetical protein SFW67_19590 [Myxococcaceae bacterium]|nr:hypothetical protein [Myxococcaceae bacterium]
MAAPGFEVTAVYVSGFRKALVDLGQLDAVVARITPETRAVLERPFSARAHSADVLRDLSDALLAVAGPEVFRRHAYLMARDALGRILTPMFKVALALTGRTPSTLLARVPDSVQQAMRGVTVTWTPAGPTAGALAVKYPEAVNRTAEEGWRGTLQFLFELIEGAPGTIARTEWLEADTRLVLHITW